MASGNWDSDDCAALYRVMASKLVVWNRGEKDFMENLCSALACVCSEDPTSNLPEFIWEVVKVETRCFLDIALDVLKAFDPNQGALKHELEHPLQCYLFAKELPQAVRVPCVP